MKGIVLEVVLSILASTSILFALYFLGRAYSSRSHSSRAVYGVEQQRARQLMQVNLIWGITLLVIGLIFWGVSGLSFGPVEAESLAEPTPQPTNPLATAVATQPLESTPLIQATETLAPLATIALSATPTTEIAAPATPTPLIAPTTAPVVTDTPAQNTAVVNSGVGVWLRSIPSTEGEQLEWVLDGTILLLLPGKQTADEFEWQQVRTPTGLEGWVAVDFIIYNN